MNEARRIKNVEYSHGFLRSARRLPERIIDLANRKEEVFRKNPYSPQLKTHKLSGKDKDAWAFWINRSYRIKFIFLRDKRFYF